MKKPVLILALVLPLFFNAKAQIYVNSAANGANNGLSWDDAFTDLQNALATAPANGVIWVAQGTYKPDTTNGNPDATFLIDSNLVLLGGFFGNETIDSLRNPDLYPTILSGDLNGDDVEDNLALNRNDNVMTVMNINSGITNATLIDGFTIRNGHSDGADVQHPQRGAGVFADNAAPTFKDCFFTQNHSFKSGGGLYIHGYLSNGALVENCRFEKNQSDADFNSGGGLYVGGVWEEGITVSHCEFIENEGNNGGGLTGFNSNLKVTNSLFSGNGNIFQGGGLWFVGESTNSFLEVDSCIFENNQSSFGGGLYVGNNSVSITNSVFYNNKVMPNGLGWGQGGGGISIYVGVSDVSVSIENNYFVENSSTNNGGGIIMYLEGNTAEINVNNCDFEKNNCTNGGSALTTQFSGNNIGFELRNCQFIENTAISGSGALDLWGWQVGTGTVVVDSCFFNSNISEFAGALSMWSGGGFEMDYTLTNSIFTNNEATVGGAIGFWCDQNVQTSISLLLENCVIDSNVGTDRAGGIVFNPESNDFNAIISRTKIINNESPIGGAVDSYNSPGVTFQEDASIHFENCLITNNISNHAAFTMESIDNLSLLNCTVTNNQSNGIHLGKQSGLSLQNTILYNPGYTEYFAISNDVTLTSNAGNLIGDGSLGIYASMYDLIESNPMFVGSDDYHLQESSLAIDKGVYSDDQPLFDLDGNDRVINCVDIGAYESEYTVGIECVTTSNREILMNESLIISPNPATDFLIVQLPKTINKPVEVSLFDLQGRLMVQQFISNRQVIEVKDFPLGMYLLKAVDYEKIYAGRFIKQ